MGKFGPSNVRRCVWLMSGHVRFESLFVHAHSHVSHLFSICSVNLWRGRGRKERKNEEREKVNYGGPNSIWRIARTRPDIPIWYLRATRTYKDKVRGPFGCLFHSLSCQGTERDVTEHLGIV